MFELSNISFLSNVRAALIRVKNLYSWQRGVKNLFFISKPIINIGRLIIGKQTIANIKSTYILLSKLNKIKHHHGTAFVCKYLKAMFILIVKFVAKDPIKSNSKTYGFSLSLTRGGLPRILPLHFRKEIRMGNYPLIRYILTICNLYRVLPFKGKFSVNTIVRPSEFVIPGDFKEWLFLAYDKNVIPKLQLNHPFDLDIIYSSGAMSLPRFISSVA